MRWGDSSSSGRTVTLKLPDDTEDHPFKGLDVGSRNGQLMEMEITLLEGDAELKTLGPKPRMPATPKAQQPAKSPSASTVSESPSSVSDPSRPPSTTASDTGPAPAPDPASTENAEGQSAAPGDFDAYAHQMSNAAESLAAVAEEMSKTAEDVAEDGEIEETGPAPLTPGQKAVVRAIDLCKAIDQQRAGFFYFMMSRYPTRELESRCQGHPRSPMPPLRSERSEKPGRRHIGA